MSNIIAIARESENRELDVNVPLYLYSEDTTFEEYINATPINEIKNESDSILSLLGGKRQYSDLNGVECLMLTFDGEKKYKNNVIVKGQTSKRYIVEIDGVNYSVYKGCVIFTKRD